MTTRTASKPTNEFLSNQDKKPTHFLGVISSRMKDMDQGILDQINTAILHYLDKFLEHDITLVSGYTSPLEIYTIDSYLEKGGAVRVYQSKPIPKKLKIFSDKIEWLEFKSNNEDKRDLSLEVNTRVIEMAKAVFLPYITGKGGAIYGLLQASKLEKPFYTLEYSDLKVKEEYSKFGLKILSQEDNTALQELSASFASTKKANEKSKKALGQFLTPREVADFIYDVLALLIKDTSKVKKVIDPACGKGIFFEAGNTHTAFKNASFYGIEIDSRLENDLKKIPNLNYVIGNGLSSNLADWNQEESFDIVAANPPYGGDGLLDLLSILHPEWESNPDAKKYKALAADLYSYIFPRLKDDSDMQMNIDSKTDTLFDLSQYKSESLSLDKQIERLKIELGNKKIKEEEISKSFVEKIAHYPIENLFLERMLRLLKPNGYLGVVIPSSQLANSSNIGVIRYLQKKCSIRMVVSLPRSVFKDCNASTNILILQKCIPTEDYEVFFAGIEDELETSLIKIKNRFSDFLKGEKIEPGYLSPAWCNTIYEKTVTTSPRMEGDFYRPKYIRNLNVLNKYLVKSLSNFISNSDIASGHRGKTDFKKKGVIYIDAKNVRMFGILQQDLRYVDKQSAFNSFERQCRYGDILINRSGDGTIGRCCVYAENFESCVSGDLYKINSTKSINPFYLAIFLNSKFGYLQLERLWSGVSGMVHLDKSDIPKIAISIVNEINQKALEKNLKYLYSQTSSLSAKLDKNTFKEYYIILEKNMKIYIQSFEEAFEKSDFSTFNEINLAKQKLN